MTSNFSKTKLAFLSGVFGMLLGIVSILMFQKITQAYPPIVKGQEQGDVVQSENQNETHFFSKNPFDSMREMRNRILKDFESFGHFDEDFSFDTGTSHQWNSQSRNYTISSRETVDSLIYEIELESSVDGDSINIDVANGMVTISGSKTSHSENDNGPSYFSSSSSFSQSFSVPSYVDSENVQMTNEGRKIILTFPKGGREV